MAGGLSEDDPYRGMELDEDLVRPNLRPKNISYQNSKNPDGKNAEIIDNAAGELGTVERLAATSEVNQRADNLDEVKDLEVKADGFYSGDNKLNRGGSKSKKKDKKKLRI